MRIEQWQSIQDRSLMSDRQLTGGPWLIKESPGSINTSD